MRTPSRAEAWQRVSPEVLETLAPVCQLRRCFWIPFFGVSEAKDLLLGLLKHEPEHRLSGRLRRCREGEEGAPRPSLQVWTMSSSTRGFVPCGPRVPKRTVSRRWAVTCACGGDAVSHRQDATPEAPEADGPLESKWSWTS